MIESRLSFSLSDMAAPPLWPQQLRARSCLPPSRCLLPAWRSFRPPRLAAPPPRPPAPPLPAPPRPLPLRSSVSAGRRAQGSRRPGRRGLGQGTGLGLTRVSGAEPALWAGLHGARSSLAPPLRSYSRLFGGGAVGSTVGSCFSLSRAKQSFPLLSWSGRLCDLIGSPQTVQIKPLKCRKGN